MDATTDKAFYGSFEVFQDIEFCRLYAASGRSDVIVRDGLVFLAKKYPLIGGLNAFVGNPEIHGRFASWVGKIDATQYAFVKVITSERVECWDDYCVSAPDLNSMFLDLRQGEQRLFDAFKRGCRREIKSGESSGVQIYPSESARDLEDFYQILSKSSLEGGLFDIFSFEQYEKLLATKYSVLFVARRNGIALGGAFFLLSKNTMHGWHGAILRNRPAEIPIGRVLYFHCMRWGVRHGYSYFDFGTQRVTENKGIFDFKMSFNPVLKPAYVYNLPGCGYKRIINLLHKNVKELALICKRKG